MSKYPFEDYFLINNKNWLDNLQLNINQISKKLELSELEINPKSRFGVVIFCKQKRKNVVLKLVDSGSQKGKRELFAINNLKYSFMNKIIKCSTSDGYYLSNRLSEIELLNETDVIGRFNIIMPIFLKVVKEWKNNALGKDTYWQKFTDKIRRINIKDLPADMVDHINYTKNLYKVYFSHEKCRLSHGDLHEKNIMKTRDKLLAIDPLGGYAPFEFEFVKYIENQLFVLPYDMIKSALNILLDQLRLLGVDSKKLLFALYIDSVERTLTSFILHDSHDIIKKGRQRINLIKEEIIC